MDAACSCICASTSPWLLVAWCCLSLHGPLLAQATVVPPEHTLLVMIPASEKWPTLEELSSTLCTLEQRFCSMLASHTAQWTPLWSSSVVSSWWVDDHTAAFEVSSPLHCQYLAYHLHHGTNQQLVTKSR